MTQQVSTPGTGRHAGRPYRRRPAATRGATADTGRLMLVLRPTVVPADVPTLQDQAEVAGLSVLRQALVAWNDPPTGRAIFDASLERILFVEAQAEWPAAVPRLSLAAFWWIDVRAVGPAEVSAFIDRATTIPGVLTAYREPTDVPPTDPLVPNQLHLHANTGISAASVWPSTGASGANARLAMVDRSWDMTHPELSGKGHDHLWPPGPVILSPPPDDVFEIAHGTLALGLATAAQNGQHGQGVAWGVSRVATSSYMPYQAGGQTKDNNLATAIWHCISARYPPNAALRPGDILLLEVMTSDGHPAEAHLLTRVAVTEAVGCGLVVVAAAGNVAADLMTVRDPAFPSADIRPFNPDGNEYWDSGSVIVGAAAVGSGSAKPVRVGGTASGQRVNCCAPGLNVQVFTGETFGNTSAASAIIAGAAAIVQSRRLHLVPGLPLGPAAMRTLLATTTSHTPSANIGVLPDVAKILALL